jgi:tetratricopeptide (TPR) repeat protein
MPHLDLARVYEKLGRAGPAEKQRLIFAKLKRLQEREDIYLQQIKEEPVDSEAHYRLGREYMKQGRYTEALV